MTADLFAKIEGTKLKVRVAGLLRTPNGYLFEKSDHDYVFPIGGKIMINETSREAIDREMMEEIGMKVGDANLIGILENLYGSGGERVHELCFVYKIGDIFRGDLSSGFVEIPVADLDKYKIRPEPIKEILKNGDGKFKHILIK